MGIILSSSHSVLKPDNKIKITNFRGLKYIENDGIFFNESYEAIERVTGLLVITRECQEYFFEEMTIDKFFEIFRATKNTKWKGRYKREVIVCRYCGGSGKSDWIKNATNMTNERYDPMNRCGFVRLKTSYKLCQETGYYLSQALVKQHEEHCKQCSGTGLHFAKPEMLINAKLQ